MVLLIERTLSLDGEMTLMDLIITRTAMDVETSCRLRLMASYSTVGVSTRNLFAVVNNFDKEISRISLSWVAWSARLARSLGVAGRYRARPRAVSPDSGFSSGLSKKVSRCRYSHQYPNSRVTDKAPAAAPARHRQACGCTRTTIVRS